MEAKEPINPAESGIPQGGIEAATGGLTRPVGVNQAPATLSGEELDILALEVPVEDADLTDHAASVEQGDHLEDPVGGAKALWRDVSEQQRILGASGYNKVTKILARFRQAFH